MQHYNKIESLILIIKSKIILNENNIKDINENSQIIVFNTESIYYYYKDDIYRDYVKNCSHIAIDGIGLKLALNIRKFKIDRFHGPELLTKIFELKNYWQIALAGGSPESLSEITRLNIVDQIIELPFSNDLFFLVNEIGSQFIPNIKGTSILLISLGLPKQEKVAQLLSKYFDKNKVVLVPIGAAIDFYTNKKIRSSFFWRKIGLEWLPRLIREPRMIPRIIKSIHGFFLLVKNG